MRGETSPAPRIEGKVTTKPELIAALQAAFSYCDGAYEVVTDETASERVRSPAGSSTPKRSVLMVNNMHSAGHYGNLVTYLRINGLVPPTSDPDFMGQMSQPTTTEPPARADFSGVRVRRIEGP